MIHECGMIGELGYVSTFCKKSFKPTQNPNSSIYCALRTISMLDLHFSFVLFLSDICLNLLGVSGAIYYRGPPSSAAYLFFNSSFGKLVGLYTDISTKAKIFYKAIGKDFNY